MDSWADEVLAMAKQLPHEDRLRIAEELQKLDADSGSREEIEQAWGEEIVRRARRIEAGEATLKDGEEVFARLRAKYAR